MASERKRLYDSAAFAAIVSALGNRPRIELKLDDWKAARRLRFEFYCWRKAEQEAFGPAYGAGIVLHVQDNVLIFSREGNIKLRDALKAAGVEISQDKTPGTQPLGSHEDVINQYYGETDASTSTE